MLSYLKGLGLAEGCGSGWMRVFVALAKGCGCAGRRQEAKEALLKGERPSLQSRGGETYTHTHTKRERGGEKHTHTQT